MVTYSSVLLRLVEHTLRLEQFYGCLFQPMYTLCICHQLCVEYCTATWRHPGLSIVNQWELSNITCMNRIDQSHSPKLGTEDRQRTDNGQTTDRQTEKWLIGLSAHAGAKNQKSNRGTKLPEKNKRMPLEPSEYSPIANFLTLLWVYFWVPISLFTGIPSTGQINLHNAVILAW